ncbi:LuxR C-terminal-related transcriptional regulator [Soonwooa sp.]|uniref:LuxR C-terminal-related transcriptional regulator n=1 Tax=Soonwooa sp. TaxID=1938592 RepID=UPI0026150D72|nr:LuxR C-terminal-related transcriptional regulator [Soonwooa sp.]
MKPNSNFISTARKFWKNVVDKEKKHHASSTKKQIEVYKRLLNIFHIGSYFHYVVDLSASEFEMISENVKDVLGYESHEMNLKTFLDNVHPDDKKYVVNFEKKIDAFFKKLPYEKLAFYKAQYDFRLKKKDGTYVRILHQTVQIDFDETHFYKTLSLDTDITHIKEDGLPCLSLIGLDDEISHYNIEDQTCDHSACLFTKRELEIIKGIVENKTSQQIADELFISLHTVNTHRRNIIEKANVKTPLELIQCAIKEAWI